MKRSVNALTLIIVILKLIYSITMFSYIATQNTHKICMIITSIMVATRCNRVYLKHTAIVYMVKIYT